MESLDFVGHLGEQVDPKRVSGSQGQSEHCHQESDLLLPNPREIS